MLATARPFTVSAVGVLACLVSAVIDDMAA